MKKNGLISNSTAAQYNPHKMSCNESLVVNELDRQFHQQGQDH
jgi:putative transposase